MASFVQDLLTSVPTWVVYLVVFLLPFLEASVLLGFVVPGETALIFGGVLASQDRASLSVVLLLAILGAVTGDGVGYAIGRRYGEALQLSRLGRVVGPDRWAISESFLQRRGAAAVFFGRFTALLRALVPGAAGMAGLPYPKFAFWNLFGGALWATACVLGGWAVGDVIGTYLSDLGYVIVGLVVVLGVGYLIHSHRVSRPD